jgi:valyl-tRNA synthetase
MTRETYLSLDEKHYDATKVENKIYELWEKHTVFKAGKDKTRKPFTIVIPPPNVTGRLHMGHALNNTTQDVLIRYKRMDGFDALWIPGTDHAGIATQTVVKKQLQAQGINYKDLGREKFVEKVWEWKQKYGDHILMQLKRMGCSCDWTKTAFTMDRNLSDAVNVAFKKMYDQGLIYKGKYIVNWCPVDKTALSDEEVIVKDGGEKGHLWYFKYPLQDKSGFITIATTRPETMLGDVAVAVNPKDDRYKNMIGKKLILPIVNREIPIIADEYVDAEFGTGCVKITPAHDPNDFQIGMRHKLEMLNIMNEDASLNDTVPEQYRGLNRFKARKQIVAEMESLGLLEKVEDRITPVGRSYRSGEIIEYRLSDQWFVKMKPLTEMALERSLKGELKFYPDRWDDHYRGWLNNLNDWCISRQLWWGHRVPAWYHKETGEILVDTQTPTDVIKNPDKWQQDEDVLDTWFSSALWPYSTLGWPEKTEDLERYYPTSILVTGKDIIMFWVVRMVTTGLFNVGKMPFHEVLINSIICDEDGETMSKSKGNGIDPLHVIDGASREDLTGPIFEARPNNMKELLARVEKLFPNGFPGVGADAMRYTLLTSATDAQQLNISLRKFSDIGRPLSDKLWNAAKLVFSMLDSNEAIKAEANKPTMVDNWLNSRLQQTITAVRHGIDNYKLHLTCEAIYHFLWSDFCDWYLEIAKFRIKDSNDAEKRLVVENIAKAFSTLITLMHPIMPFITEEIWGHLKPRLDKHNISSSNQEILALVDFPVSNNQIDPVSIKEFSIIQQIVRSIRTMRLNANVSPKIELDCYVKFNNVDDLTLLNDNMQLIVNLANLKSLAPTDKIMDNYSAHVADDLAVYLNLSEHIDTKAELLKNQKALEKAKKVVEALQAKLSNEDFVARAPEAVVKAEKAKLSEAVSKVQGLESIIKSLN